MTNDYVWMEEIKKCLLNSKQYQNADLDNTFWPSILLKVESCRKGFYKNFKLMKLFHQGSELSFKTCASRPPQTQSVFSVTHRSQCQGIAGFRYRRIGSYLNHMRCISPYGGGLITIWQRAVCPAYVFMLQFQSVSGREEKKIITQPMEVGHSHHVV